MEIFSNSDLIQRRAAPMPRVVDTVSEKVLRVPKLTSLRMSASRRWGEAALAMVYNFGSDWGGSAFWAVNK